MSQVPDLRSQSSDIPVTVLSSHDEWETPVDFYNKLDEEFHFRLDPCCRADTAKCEYFFTKEDDGLKQDWYPYGSVFMNPPYGRAVPKWLQKAQEESNRGCTVVALIGARVGTKWWKQYCEHREHRILGRLKFRGWSKKHQKIVDDVGATFDSAVVIFRPPDFGQLKAPLIFRNPRPRGPCPMCEQRGFIEIPNYGWMCVGCNTIIRPGR